ncbi:hypothetical protein [Hoylesella nanceiensis]|uniref:hypothetical protein n=1 Tax=Hoylesella nanceiensis TaxID=425941 RepID=UPI001CB16CCB|nr:hypothetical protein [Hoylesella nanceiensis]MBF1421246.1 hypothetical protein [Hoylesella nanceiensis]
METWMILFVVSGILSSTCPFTSRIGALFGSVTVIAKPIFVVLSFFFSPVWWYGLIAVSIYLFIPLLIPKVDPLEYGKAARVYSSIGSHANIVIVILMFLNLFGVF